MKPLLEALEDIAEDVHIGESCSLREKLDALSIPPHDGWLQSELDELRAAVWLMVEGTLMPVHVSDIKRAVRDAKERQHHHPSIDFPYPLRIEVHGCLNMTPSFGGYALAKRIDEAVHAFERELETISYTYTPVQRIEATLIGTSSSVRCYLTTMGAITLDADNNVVNRFTLGLEAYEVVK